MLVILYHLIATVKLLGLRGHIAIIYEHVGYIGKHRLCRIGTSVLPTGYIWLNIKYTDNILRLITTDKAQIGTVKNGTRVPAGRNCDLCSACFSTYKVIRWEVQKAKSFT